ncbi:MAG: hypothetical protein AB1625_02160 [Acidobacteriota bacterium]
MRLLQRGTRLFVGASIGLLLVAAAHTAGHFSGGSSGAEVAAAEAAMRQARLDAGLGMAPTVLDVFLSLSLTMSVLLVALAAANLAAIGASSRPDELVRPLAVVSAAACLALAALYLRYRVAPPLLSFAVLTPLFAAAAARGRERKRPG